MSMYRQAVRMAGPQPLGNMGKAFAAAILDHGFVGIASHLQTVSAELVEVVQVVLFRDH